MPAVRRERTVVAAVGNAWLKDQAFGIHVVERLARRKLPDDVQLVDWSFGTIAAFQHLARRRFERAVIVSGTSRDRPPGTLHSFAPAASLPEPAELHGRVADSVMGLVAVDNLVHIARYYGKLPPAVTLVEAEPADDTWGNQLSPKVERLVDPAVKLILQLIGRRK